MQKHKEMIPGSNAFRRYSSRQLISRIYRHHRLNLPMAETGMQQVFTRTAA